ncbi:MAG: hypothetical protein Q4D16_21940 [Eubacteriales bacterium]|nr:hypothetical protein [Eubacteriales bacterium]
MDNIDSILTSGPELTDGESVSEAQFDTYTDAYTLSVSDYGLLTVSSIPIGALCGAIIMIVGLAVMGIVKIFKKA